MKKYPCIESTFEVTVNGNISIRVWKDESDIIFPRQDNPIFLEVQRIINDLIRQGNEGHKISVAEITEALAEVKGLNAVQVRKMSPDGNFAFGCMVYTVPFAEDSNDPR